VKYTKAKVKDGADPKALKPVDLVIPMFGYKNHIGIDRAHGLIRTWDASAANTHQGARLLDMISRDNTGSESGPIRLTGRRRTRPSSPTGCSKSHTTSANRTVARCRGTHRARQCEAVAYRLGCRARLCRAEHRMGLTVRTIGIARARIKIGMANLAYLML
jgi:IS5 family transposase